MSAQAPKDTTQISWQDAARYLKSQYLLVPTSVSISLPGWTNRELGDWKLASDPALGVADVVGSDGRVIGWVLGHAIDSRIGLVAGSLTMQVESSDDERAVGEAIEAWLETTGGRYLVVIITAHLARLYVDAGGFLPATYGTGPTVISSSPQLALLASGRTDDCDPSHAKLRAELDIPKRDHWYPFGLTSCPSISRLLPNHYLDIEQGTPTRYWPAASSISDPQVTLDHVVTVIAEILEEQVGQILAKSDAYVSLTAGYDSRMILAATRHHREKITCFTVDSNAIDVKTAKRLAASAGVPHIVQHRLPSSTEQVETWLVRTGYSIAGAGARSLNRRPTFRDDMSALGGFGGEVGRGFYWGSVDSMEPDGVTAADLVSALKLPPSRMLREAADSWLSGLPRLSDVRDVLDLAYVEQRLGCWAAPQQLSQPSTRGRFHPLVHRGVFAAMLSLPSAMRGDTRIAEGVSRRLWPALLRVPFNPRPPLWRRAVSAVRKQVERRSRALTTRG